MVYEEVYLKCNIISPGFFNGQYIVNFAGSEKSYPPSGEFRVYEGALIKKEENSGLVKATLIRKDKDSSIVVVKDNEQGGFFLKFPMERLFLKKID